MALLFYWAGGYFFSLLILLILITPPLYSYLKDLQRKKKTKDLINKIEDQTKYSINEAHNNIEKTMHFHTALKEYKWMLRNIDDDTWNSWFELENKEEIIIKYELAMKNAIERILTDGIIHKINNALELKTRKGQFNRLVKLLAEVENISKDIPAKFYNRYVEGLIKDANKNIQIEIDKIVKI